MSSSNTEIIQTVPDMKMVPAILSPAVRVGDLLFCSGQTPIDGKGNIVGEGDIGEMTAQCVRNLEKVLKHAGSSLEKVVKVTVFLDDMADFAKMNARYEQLFPKIKPARSCISVTNPGYVKVEIECIATI